MRATNSEPSEMLQYLWKFAFSIFYARKSAQTGQREIVRLQPSDVDHFVEKCIEDPTDFVGVSSTLLQRAGGAETIERLLLVSYEELQQWLTADPPSKPQPGVTYDGLDAEVRVNQ
jgi:hypothetical protein